MSELYDGSLSDLSVKLDSETLGVSNVHDLPVAVAGATSEYDKSLNELQGLASSGGDINLTEATALTAEVQVNQAISEMVQGVVKNAADALKKQGQRLG